MFVTRATCAVALLLAGGFPAAGANLIRNGSFEKPLVPDGQLKRFATGSSFTGWTVVGDPGSVDIITSGFTFEGQNFPAKRGNQWLDLTGASDTATGVQQTIATSPGTTYDVSFFLGSAYDPTGQLGTSSKVHLMVDGSEIASFRIVGTEGVPQRWRKFVTQFVAQSTTTTIAFINGDPANDTDCGIDGVTLVAVP